MEGLANVNQFGVCELREDVLREVDGGNILTSFLIDYMLRYETMVRERGFNLSGGQKHILI